MSLGMGVKNLMTVIARWSAIRRKQVKLFYYCMDSLEVGFRWRRTSVLFLQYFVQKGDLLWLFLQVQVWRSLHR